MDPYMKLTASWGPWSDFKTYHRDDFPFRPFQSRRRLLYVGGLHLCVLVESMIAPATPFFFYFPGYAHPARGVRYATLDAALAAIRLILEAPL